MLSKLLEPNKFEVDSDGDFTFPFKSTRVWVAPRGLPGGPLVVRVFAVTNVDIDPTPALGLFLSETNFALAFGRFALDAPRRAVWFEETLLGDFVADEELTFVVQIVASTADQFDDRIAAAFGGRVFNSPESAGAAEEVPSEKPGAAGYL
ncbi:MAG: YbjN domain-containing protein [Acidimicrobiia bacterium]|nr:YbjN domain-containing protein [Acidimicrobiia bacterium]